MNKKESQEGKSSVENLFPKDILPTASFKMALSKLDNESRKRGLGYATLNINGSKKDVVVSHQHSGGGSNSLDVVIHENVGQDYYTYEYWRIHANPRGFLEISLSISMRSVTILAADLKMEAQEAIGTRLFLKKEVIRGLPNKSKIIDDNFQWTEKDIDIEKSQEYLDLEKKGKGFKKIEDVLAILRAIKQIIIEAESVSK